MNKNNQFGFSKKPLVGIREGLRDGVLPLAGILAITAVLVAFFALFIHFGIIVTGVSGI